MFGPRFSGIDGFCQLPGEAAHRAEGRSRTQRHGGVLVKRSAWIASATLTALAIALTVPASAYQRPGATERVSVSSTGAQGNDNSGRCIPCVAMTPDGRYVSFESSASNLVPGDANAADDIFVY